MAAVSGGIKGQQEEHLLSLLLCGKPVPDYGMKYCAVEYLAAVY